jgi:hypothetical protein
MQPDISSDPTDYQLFKLKRLSDKFLFTIEKYKKEYFAEYQSTYEETYTSTDLNLSELQSLLDYLSKI